MYKIILIANISWQHNTLHMKMLRNDNDLLKHATFINCIWIDGTIICPRISFSRLNTAVYSISITTYTITGLMKSAYLPAHGRINSINNSIINISRTSPGTTWSNYTATTDFLSKQDTLKTCVDGMKALDSVQYTQWIKCILTLLILVYSVCLMIWF